MKLLYWISLRSIKSRPMRTILSMFGIMIGVAGILALGITNQSAMEAISLVFEESGGRADLTIVAASGEQGLPSSVYRTASNISGIRAAVPIIKIQTALADQEEANVMQISFFGAESGGLLLHGIDPGFDPLAREYTTTAGRFLSNNLDIYEIVLVEDYANDENIKLGDRVGIITPNGIEKLRVVGLLAKEGAGQTNNGMFGIIPVNAAQKMFNRLGEYDQIDLLLLDSSNNQVIEDKRIEIERRIGEDYAVTYPSGQGQRMSQMLSNYQIGLNFLSAIALFVGAFLIYNAFAMTIVERTREFGMMRTIGMTRQQITLMVISEAVLMGLMGSILGIFVGILGAQGLASLMGNLLGTDLNTNMQVPPDTLILSLFIGMAVTIFAATLPSIQAGKISPIAALRIRGVQKEGWIMRSGWKLGFLLLIISTAILIWNPYEYDPQFRLGSLTVFFMFTGITLIIPSTVEIWEKITRLLIQKIYGNSGIIGSRNLQRSKSRTTLTVAALLIGVAMILVVRSMTASFSIDLKEWINAYLGGDLYVYSSIPLRDELSRQIGRVEGVQAATPIHYKPIEFKMANGTNETITFMAIDPPTYTQVTNFVFTDVDSDKNISLNKLSNGNAIFISSVIAEKYGITRGDVMFLKTHSGFHAFEVADIVVDFYDRGLVVTGNRQDLRRYFRSNEVSTILVKANEGMISASIQEKLDDLYGKRYRLTIESNDSIRESILNLLNQAFSMFDVMVVLAVVVASLGIVNTLTMNVLERTREIGMLRAIGMTRKQVIHMILAEAGLMGVIGGILGLAFGILLARIFLVGMATMSGYRLNFIVPISGVITGIVVALVVSQITAIQPAKRAAKTNVLEAIHYE